MSKTLVLKKMLGLEVAKCLGTSLVGILSFFVGSSLLSVFAYTPDVNRQIPAPVREFSSTRVKIVEVEGGICTKTELRPEVEPPAGVSVSTGFAGVDISSIFRPTVAPPKAGENEDISIYLKGVVEPTEIIKRNEETGYRGVLSRFIGQKGNAVKCVFDTND